MCVPFDHSNDEIIVFRRKRKPQLKRRIVKARIIAGGDTMSFNTEGTRCLGVYLDTKLQF